MKENHDPESWKWLVEEFTGHVCRLCQGSGVSPGALMNMKLKSRGVVIERARLIRILRNEYAQERRRGAGPIQFGKAADVEFDAQPLSTPTIARLFGGTHSAIVLALKRL